MEKNKKTKTVSILIVLIAFAGCAAFAAYSHYNGVIRDPMSAFVGNQTQASRSFEATGTQPPGVTSAAQATGDTTAGCITYGGTLYKPNANVINVLLLGIDWDEKRQDMGWRSDMNMLCTVDFAREKITLTSIPRDTRTKVYMLNKKTGEVKSSGTDKLNAAYSYGGGPDKFGAQNAMRCVGEFLSDTGKYNVPVHHYISIDLAGIPKFASALGGVCLTLDVDFPGLGSKGDTVVLDESNSRRYLENRKQVGGELVRIQHEQQYLMAVARKIKEKGAVSLAPSLYGAFLQFMNSNLSLEQIIALSKVLDKTEVQDIKLQTIDGDIDYISDISYFIADKKDLENKVVSLMYTPAE